MAPLLKIAYAPKIAMADLNRHPRLRRVPITERPQEKLLTQIWAGIPFTKRPNNWLPPGWNLLTQIWAGIPIYEMSQYLIAPRLKIANDDLSRHLNLRKVPNDWLPPWLKSASADLSRLPRLRRVPITERPPAENCLRRFEPASPFPKSPNNLLPPGWKLITQIWASIPIYEKSQ